MNVDTITHVPLRKLVLSITLVMICFFSIASQQTGASWRGKTAKQNDNPELLSDGPHTINWKSRDLEVDYTYTSKEGNLEIEGTVNLASHLKNSFRSLVNFSVFLNVLDDNKRIMDSRVIAIAGAIPIRTIRFQDTFPLPPEATALNFSYSGVATEGGTVGSGGGDDGGGSTFFWQNP